MREGAVSQRPLVTIEGRDPKKRVGWLSAFLVCSCALFLPVRLRLAFTFAINFIYNHVLATTRVLLFFLGRQSTALLILFTYLFVLGPLSLIAKLLRRDFLSVRPAEDPDSFFTVKEPADEGEERFERQF